MPKDDLRAAVERAEADPIGFFLRLANAGNKKAGNDLIERFVRAVDGGGEINGRLLAFVAGKLRRIVNGENPRKVFPKPTKTGRPNKDDEHWELATRVAERMLGEPREPESLDEFDLDNWERASTEEDAIAKVADATGISEHKIKKAFQDWRRAAYWWAAYGKKSRGL